MRSPGRTLSAHAPSVSGAKRGVVDGADAWRLMGGNELNLFRPHSNGQIKAQRLLDDCSVTHPAHTIAA